MLDPPLRYAPQFVTIIIVICDYDLFFACVVAAVSHEMKRNGDRAVMVVT